MEDSMIQEKIGFELHMDVGCDVAISKVTSALKQEGFGVLTTIDVKQTLKEKLDADFRSYMILGACNPSLAQRALNADLDVGLLLPCNVVVYESGHGSVISIVDPLVMLGVMSNPALKPIAAEAHAKLKRVYESLRS
jgi:uncharacterized protein (DUF302 family)